MQHSVESVPPSAEPSAITLDELIRGQLQGKLGSLGRYDEILWKIRAGYVAVIYGMLALLVGKESKLVELLGPEGLLHSLFPISAGLSVCALLIDAAFLLAKLRVVAARDRLSDLAASRANGRQLTESERSELVQLLHLSGEAFTMPPLMLVLGGIWSLLGIYLFTPLAMILLIQ
jgi:hypothetical protein